MAVLLSLAFSLAAYQQPVSNNLDTGVISCIVSPSEGVVRRQWDGLTISRGKGEPHFRIELEDGTSLSSTSYRHARTSLRELAGDSQEITVEYIDPEGKSPPLEVIYNSQRGRHYFYKKIRCGGDSVIKSIVVERLAPTKSVSVGGLGEPMFIGDDWFVALEHPAGYSRLERATDGSFIVELSHYPGTAGASSFSAVIGTRGRDDANIRDAFDRYLQTVIRPPKPWLVFNSWYDVRNAQLTPERLTTIHGLLNQKLLQPFHLSFDAFMIDDGWQEPKSIWKPNAVWQEGFQSLSKVLEKSKSRLGLWLPLNGQSLDTTWGASQGYKRSNHRKGYYCLADEKYNAALRQSIKERIEDGRLSFLKHDFNFLECSEEGHGHLPTDEHGREANVVAQLKLMEYIRSIHPDIGLAVTSNAWPSPFWLIHADFVWMGSYDYAENWNTPCWSKRQAEMTFRDATLHRLLSSDGIPIPASSLMTHGIIRGTLEGSDADRGRDWWDAIALQFGRGTMLQELYITPELITLDEEWSALGNAIKWAQANVETLAHTRMIGGSPARGEAYGYAHWSENKGIFCLRNPSPRPIDFEITTLERPRHLAKVSSWLPVLVYPHRERLNVLDASKSISVRLNGFDVAIIECYSELPLWLTGVGQGRFWLERRDQDDIVREATIVGNGPSFTTPIRELDRLTASMAVEAAEDVRRAWLLTLTNPASGLSFDRPAGNRSVAANGQDWELWQSEAIRTATINAHLPPTPFWPKEASFSMVARSERMMTATKTRKYPSGTIAWLPEPDYQSDRRFVQESVIVDGWNLHRSRWQLELWAWILVLGVMPMLLGWLMFRWMTRESTVKWRTALTLALLLVALYCFTPVGSALGRTLMELR